MTRDEKTSPSVATDAGIYLNHADDMLKRAASLKERMYEFADDLAGIVIMLETGKRIAASALTQAADRTGHAPRDSELTDAEIKDKNG